MRENNSTHLIIIFLLTIITLNLFILDIRVFSPSSNIQLSDISISITPLPTQTSAGNILPQNLICPNSCIALIEQASESSRLGASNLTNLSNSSNTSTQKAVPGGRQEFYIPLGTGSTAKSDWEDITATEITIDPANYGNIKEAYFIASLRNPTQNGQVEVQLYNVTDKHPVWNSQVTLNGPKEQTITSGKITLSTGAKLYRVQLKSTLSFQAFLDNAKIRIISE